ncbi:MAG: AI-2E family transporter [Waddliaceae bacterium]
MGMLRFITVSLAFFSFVLLIGVLISAQDIFIPFLIALVIAYFILILAKGIRTLSLYGRHIPSWLALIGSISLLLGGIYLIFVLVSNNVTALLEAAPVYQQKLTSLVRNFFDFIGRPVPDFSKEFKELDVGSWLTNIVFTLTDIAGRAGIIGIYLIFILVESQYFEKKLLYMFNSNEARESAKTIIKTIMKQIQFYVVIKTVMGVITAILSYGILRFVGVNFADFWALLIFLFNYIPTIGAIVATILPCVLTLVQFESLFPFLVAAIGLTAIHFVIGNIVEPRTMGKYFNLSGLVIILSLVVWGQIWGIIGMFLGVPFMMIISIVLSNFPRLRPIAVLLSQKGTVDHRLKDEANQGDSLGHS